MAWPWVFQVLGDVLVGVIPESPWFGVGDAYSVSAGA